MSDEKTAGYFLRKADQHWGMALARQDGDRADEKRHRDRAQEYERLAAEAAG